MKNIKNKKKKKISLNKINLLSKEIINYEFNLLSKEIINYEFNYDLSKKSSFSIIFTSKDKKSLIKILFIKDNPNWVGEIGEPIYLNFNKYDKININNNEDDTEDDIGTKYTISEKEYLKELEINKKINKLNISPNLENDIILDGIKFKKIISNLNDYTDIYNIFTSEYAYNKNYLLDNKIKIGILKIQYLDDYDTLQNVWEDCSDQKKSMICENLKYNINQLHLLGYNHCDLHTNNILVNLKTNDVKLIDFGNSKLLKKNFAEYQDKLYESENECDEYHITQIKTICKK